MAVVIAGAMSSAFSCLVGGVIPVLIIWLVPTALLIPAIVVVTLLALLLLGWLSAYSGGSRPWLAIVRVVGLGGLAMLVTYLIGHWIGVAL